MSPSPLGGWAAALTLALGLAAATPAQADKVGVAAAVNPDAFSSLNGSPKTQLNIGKSIFYNEHINTTGSGLVQVLLVDGSTFTVGPGSDLTIDKFVYDPNKKTGEIAATFSKGVMRFVGGKISKNEGGVTVDTPAGALAIRGGMFQTNGKVYSFLYGDHMTLTGRNGQTYNVFQPGNSIDTTTGTPTIRPTTQADINSVMAALTNGSGGSTGNPTGVNTGPTPGQKYTSVETPSLQNLISQATQTQINGQLNEQEQQDTTGTPGTPDTPDSPQPIPIKARVLTPPNSFTAYGTSFENPAGNGILGGDDDPEVDADDFVWTFDLGTGRFQGTVTGLNDGSGDFKPGTVDFPFVGLQGQNGIFPINPEDGATITQLDQVNHYVGYVAVEQDFFAYNLASTEQGNDHPERLLVFGGQGYDFNTAPPNTKIYEFDLSVDPGQADAFGPFASRISSPTKLEGITTYPTGMFTSDGGNGFISPLVLLDKDRSGADDPSHAVWLQANFFVGSGDQKGSSFINIALGEWSEQGGVTGFRRGGSVVLGSGEDPSSQTYSFSGDIASLAGPDQDGNLSYFMGSQNPNIVIGADSTGTHNIFRDTPLDPAANNDTVEEQSSATYHVGIGQATDRQPAQTSGTMTGYAAGFGQHPDSSQPDFVANFSPSDVTLSFDATTNTMTGSFKVGQIDLSSPTIVKAVLTQDLNQLLNPRFNLGFGGPGRSAFIDDQDFAAIESGGSSVSQNYVVFHRGPFGIPIPKVKSFTDNNPVVEGFLVSSDAIKADAVLFGTNPDTGAPNKHAFCNDCAFMKWGAWGARVDYQQQNGQVATADVPLGWWIAGDVVAKKDLPTTGKAWYAGDAIGNVVNNGTQYTATGNMNMCWNFGKRSGQLTISNFDNRSFSGTMFAPGQVAFSGGLAGSGLAGAANGSFVGSPGHGQTPQGVIGNFGVAGSNYQATGIFGGTAVQPR
jgi:hypothetical protein